MAKAKDVLLRFLVDDKQKSKLAGIGNEAQKTQSKFQQLTGAGKGLVAGFAAVAGTKILGFLKDATTAALEDAKAQELLKLAVQNSTDATNADITAMETWITKTSLATGIADDELRPALAELARTTGDLEEAQETLGVAMDIATAKSIPLETVTKAIGKAALGNVGALGRLGVATKNAAGETLTFQEVLDEATRTMGGATATAADTAAGQMQILKVRIDEAKEAIGARLIPILEDGADAANDFARIAEFAGEKLGGGGGLASKVEETTNKYLEWLNPLAATTDILDFLGDKVDEATEAEEANLAVVETAADRYDEMSGAIDQATVSLEEHAEEIRAQMDPIFNLADKINDLSKAQTDTAQARDKYGEGSLEHQEALRKEAGAFLTLKDAQAKAAAESGITRETYRKNLEAMGILTRAEVDIMMAEFDRLDGRIIDTTINVNLKGRGASTFNDALTGAKAAGGPVLSGGTYLVGEQGPEILSMGTSNGHITPNSQLGGASYAIHVTAGLGVNGQQLGKQIVEEIRKFEKGSGTGWRS